jgi:STAS-like domain of unknown function (DUF4325)
MITIQIREQAGSFAENKDIARALREETLLPVLRNSDEVTLDFSGVEGATQSFIHALISEAIRMFGPEVLDHIIFKGCNDTVKQIIAIVTEYMQEH